MNAIETLISVLCGPGGKCCISGSDDDRRLIDSALAELAQAAQPAPAETGNSVSAQTDSVLEDAARYRWLRAPTTDVALVLDKRTEWVPPDDVVPGVGGYWVYEYRAGDELDAAVDAARKQGGAT